MTYEAKIKLQFDSVFEQSYGSGYCDDCLPEEHVTMEIPAQDLNTSQAFRFFSNFLRAIGHNEVGIMKGACNVAFNESNSQGDMKKVAEEYDLFLAEDVAQQVEDRVKTELDILKEWDKINQNRILSKEPTADPTYGEDDFWEKSYWDLRKAASTKIQDLEEQLSTYRLAEVPNNG